MIPNGNYSYRTMISTELALVLYTWDRGCRAFAVWVSSAPWKYNKNWTLEVFVLKGLIFSECPGCSWIFRSIMTFGQHTERWVLLWHFHPCIWCTDFASSPSRRETVGKDLCYKRLQRQAFVLMNIGSRRQVPGSRKHGCIREQGRYACQQEMVLAWGRPWRSSLVNCRVRSECKAQHSTDNHPATPEKSRNRQCECNLIMRVHHAT